MLDTEKAFDSVWHTSPFSIKFVNETKFNPLDIPAGKPQWSCLSSVLYIVFISDMPKPDRCKMALYAADTAIFTSSPVPETPS